MSDRPSAEEVVREELEIARERIQEHNYPPEVAVLTTIVSISGMGYSLEEAVAALQANEVEASADSERNALVVYHIHFLGWGELPLTEEGSS